MFSRPAATIVAGGGLSVGLVLLSRRLVIGQLDKHRRANKASEECNWNRQHQRAPLSNNTETHVMHKGNG